MGPQGPARPKPEDLPPDQLPPDPAPEPKAAAAADASEKKVRLGHMDIMKDQKRVSWDELKNKLATANIREAGTPGSNEFDDYATKLEKTRNERLQQQEQTTKKALKAASKGKKDKKKKKDKKAGGLKRTADGAVLAQSSGDESSEQE